jgi:DNA-binding response OmpR family regulator
MRMELQAVAYELDCESLSCLRDALPGWQIQVVRGAVPRPTEKDWIPGEAGLVVLGTNVPLSETLGICRALRSRVGWGTVPLLALVPPQQAARVRTMLEAGADSCLVLPVHPKEIKKMVSDTGRGTHPGQHTLNLHQPCRTDENRDEGGEG